MGHVDTTIEVNVPVGTAYNQWTQFEDFPQFMDGIEEVRQVDTSRLFWAARIGGERREWYARIVRQVPDKVLAWESETGSGNSGTVIFKELDETRTQVELHMEYETENLRERLADSTGLVSRQVDGDLRRFKEYIEERGIEAGAWRGEIMHGKERLATPLMDSSDAPDEDQIRFGESPLR